MSQIELGLGRPNRSVSAIFLIPQMRRGAANRLDWQPEWADKQVKSAAGQLHFRGFRVAAAGGPKRGASPVARQRLQHPQTNHHRHLQRLLHKLRRFAPHDLPARHLQHRLHFLNGPLQLVVCFGVEKSGGLGFRGDLSPFAV